MGLRSVYYSARSLMQYDPACQKFVRRMLIAAIVIGYLAWTWVLKRPVYQMLYGKPTAEALTITTDKIIDMPAQPVRRATVNGFDIDIQLRKQFVSTARIVYVDRYSWLGTWYRSRDGAKLYDHVVPLDVSTVSGKTAEVVSCFEFDHEYRFLFWRGTCSYRDEDVNNNHVIPATPNIQKGLDILRVGDIARLEGYLVFWQGTGKYAPYRFESAVTLGEESPYIVNGTKAGLCRQLYLTKLSFDGYTFE